MRIIELSDAALEAMSTTLGIPAPPTDMLRLDNGMIEIQMPEELWERCSQHMLPGESFDTFVLRATKDIRRRRQ